MHHNPETTTTAAAAPSQEIRRGKAILWLAKIVARVPQSTLPSLARLLGRVSYGLYSKHRELALRNVQKFYPDTTISFQRTLVIRCFQHMFQAAFDLLRFAAEDSSRWPTITIKNLEKLEAALGTGRGVVLITAHYGNFELLLFALRDLSPTPWFLWHKPTSKVGWVVEQFRRYREAILPRRTGCMPLESTVKGAMKAGHLLKRGNVVVMAADLVWGSGFITTTLLDRPFRMSRVPASISLRTRAVLLPVITARRPDGRYDIIVEEPIAWSPTVSKDEAERAMTQSFAQILGNHIDSAPEQWCWTQLVET